MVCRVFSKDITWVVREEREISIKLEVERGNSERTVPVSSVVEQH